MGTVLLFHYGDIQRRRLFLVPHLCFYSMSLLKLMVISFSEQVQHSGRARISVHHFFLMRRVVPIEFEEVFIKEFRGIQYHLGNMSRCSEDLHVRLDRISRSMETLAEIS